MREGGKEGEREKEKDSEGRGREGETDRVGEAME